MAAYQRMTAGTNPTQREEALTVYGIETGQNSVPVLETALTELEAFMTLWDVKPRVEENSLETLSVDKLITQLRKMCKDAEDRASNAQEEARQKRKEALEQAVTATSTTKEETNLRSNSSQNKACNYKEFRAVMHENFHGTEGAVGLTRWFEKLESQFGISNVAEGDRVKFASSTLLDGALNWFGTFKQMENELWNLKVKGTNLTAYNQRFQELILLCPEMVPNADRLLEHYIEGLPLSIKGNVTSSKPVDFAMKQLFMASVQKRQQGCLQPGKVLMLANYLTAKSVDDTTPTHALLLVTIVERQGIRSNTVEPHLVPQAKEDSEAKEDREMMLLVLDVVRRDITRTSVRTTEVKAVETKFEVINKILRTIRGRIKETLKEITKHQPALKKDAERMAEYTAYVLKLL
ncbi:hypothetical protein Tco_1309870 [Tanacetum coccineum]